MMKTLLKYLVALLVLPAWAPIVSAQTGTFCRPVDGVAKSLVQWVGATATGTDSASAANRAQYGVPATTWNNISIMTDAKTCKAAGEAYSRELQVTPTGGRPVIVVKVGDVYVVEDPTVKVREWTQGTVFTRRWVLLSIYVG
jgi:hypothetical protein